MPAIMQRCGAPCGSVVPRLAEKSAGKSPATLDLLFAGQAATGLLIPDGSDRVIQRLAQLRDTVVHGCEQGLIRTPAWGRGRFWLSGTVRATAEPHRSRPGWIANAFDAPVTVGDRERGQKAAAAILEHRLGVSSFETARVPSRRVVVSPVAADDSGAAARALDRCLARHDASSIALILAANSVGRHWSRLLDRARRAGVAILAEPGDPWTMLDGCTDLYASPASRWALLARLAGLAVHDGGTADDTPAWITAALVTGVRYADPFRRETIGLEAALDIAVDWHRHGRGVVGISACVGMSVWKRRRMRQFLSTGNTVPAFSRLAATRSNGAVAAWASRVPPGLAEELRADGRALVRVEDGFIRSRGLGSNFLPPCSVVLDWSGQYVDPSAPSDLERLLAETEFPPALLDRAQRLIARLIDEGVTKYGSISAAPPARRGTAGQRVLLVPGQVADDLSVRLAGCGMDNAALLTAVRAAEPNAFIVYKPHPDVIAGHRPGVIDFATARFADEIVNAGNMHDLVSSVDAVHTITSLAGFEALLRGREVVTYGQPFYAGWGLTTDRNPVLRRQRRLSVEALVAAALLLFPHYVDPVTGMPCPAEVVLDRMADPAVWRPGLLTRLRVAQGRVKAALARRRGPLEPQRQAP
ncbi:MAG: hypothetical protein ACRYF2_13440 [Janthinobacterium lividum]